MNLELAILVFGVLASLIQALSFFLLKQIFNELKSIRETFRDYVPKDMCEVKMDGHHLRIKDIEDSLHLVLIAGGCLLLCGCGHNAVSYGKGFQVETTANPETWTFGFSVRYGELFTAAVKEKTRVTFSTSAKADAGRTAGQTDKADLADKTDTATTLTIETGDQITGYTVDLEKAKKEAASVQSAGQEKNTVSTTATSNKE